MFYNQRHMSMAESKISCEHKNNSYDLILDTSISATSTEQTVNIPNADSYKALYIEFFTDTNNGMAYYFPRELGTMIVPFYAASRNHNYIGAVTGGYAFFTQGNIAKNKIVVNYCVIDGWTTVRIRVFGLK